MGGLINSGVSGLNAYKKALDVVGHNIANVNTEGYSRKVIEFTTRLPTSGDGGLVGDGVNIQSIRRVSNQFLANQFQFHTANRSHQEAIFNNSQFLDKLLSGKDSSLNPQLQKFFKDIKNLAANPTAGRAVVMSEGRTLVQKIQFLASRFQSEFNTVNLKLDQNALQINSITSSIAKLNQDIEEMGAASGNPPSDLLDKRDQLLVQLSSIVGVNTTTDSSGMVNVSLGNGQPIVARASSFEVTTMQDPNNPGYRQLALATPSGPLKLSGIKGGQIGGLLEYRDKVLEKGMRMLDHTALGVAHSFNQQHQIGIDLNGNLGKSFFTDMNALAIAQKRATANASNTGSAQFSVRITDIGKVSNEKFELSFSSATSTYTLTRMSDSSVVATFAAAALPQTVTDAGIQLTLDSGTVQDGDRFVVEPTKGAASDIEVTLVDGNEIAAASALNISSGNQNKGSGKFEITNINNQVGTTLPASAITLTFDPLNNQFTASDGSGPYAYNPATESGKEFTLSVTGFADVKFRVTGVPGLNDTFAIDKNLQGSSDGRNATELANLQVNKQLDGGLRSVTDVYNELVSMVGTKTFEAEVSERSSRSLLAQVKESQDSISGVSLDEEAANLIKFSQAYRAAAQLIRTANDTFITLMNAIGG